MYLGEANEVFEPPAGLAAESHVGSFADYLSLYEESVKDPPAFWGRIAEQLYFKVGLPIGDREGGWGEEVSRGLEEPWTPENFSNCNLDVRKGPISIKWMEGAKTNVCYNCVDRHVADGRGDNVAFYWYPHLLAPSIMC